MTRTKKRARRGGSSVSYSGKKKYKANPEVNCQGAIISYDKNKRNMCVKECNALFDEYKEKLLPEEESQENEETTDLTDISAAIASELGELKNKSNKVTMQSKDLANCLGFLQVNDPNGMFSSVEFFRFIFKEMRATQIAKTRYLHRLIPIETTCVATLGAINEKLEPLLNEKLGKEIAAKTYAIEFKCRNNSAIKRDDIYTLVNATVRDPHSVDLSNPDVTIVIEVVNTWCGIAMIENARDFGTFSIRSIIEQKESTSKTPEKLETNAGETSIVSREESE